MTIPKPPIERFLAHTKPGENGCIEWTAARGNKGYGRFQGGGYGTTETTAHRWAYLHFVGPIPDGYQVDHLCRNRACVNPEHLEAVTPQENTLRSNNPAAINARKTHCPRNHPLADDNLLNYGGRRVCKLCRKAWNAAQWQKRKAAR